MVPWANRPVGRLCIAASLVAIIGGCNATEPPTSSTAAPSSPQSAVPTATPSAAPTVTLPEIRLDERVELADGRTLSARCLGSGTPTILLEVGGSNDKSDWAPQFVNELAMTTTTCLYSRAGGPGSAPPRERPVSMDDVTSDAFELLEFAKANAGVEGPYVFVGWSLGGSVALANALTRPDQTVGIAILDSDFPGDFMAICAEQGRPPEECQAAFESDIDALFMEGQIAQAVHPLDLPAVLVTAMEYPDCQESPSATLSAEIAGTTVVAADCAGLATAIADVQIARWRPALPEITQIRVQADHDGLVVSEGRQIARLILGIVEAERALE